MSIGQDTMIDVQGVTKHYRRGREMVTALHEVSFAVGRGELVAIVGTSGSGKTTLAHIIGGLITPDDGEVVARGITLHAANDHTLSAYRNRHVGFVFQHFSLIPYYTALENVLLPLIVDGMSSRKRKKLAVTLLERVGLAQQISQRADTLSGGERQRVAIARALAMKPDIIIADEPTGSLDSARGLEIMELLETLSSKHHITVLMVTHDTTLARRADRIIELKDGRMVTGAAVARS